ncbi:MAG: magnesium transporter CorA family protein [Clostridia bacterium]|nr:magnesium transporter CorA family protein [Clostridia bacterium]
MINYYLSQGSDMRPLDTCVPGCWVNVTSPTEPEINSLIENFGLEPDFIRAALDEEESSRIESEDGNTLIIIDIPYREELDEGIVYTTMPIGIVVTANNVITVSLRENKIVSELCRGGKGINTAFKTRFVLSLMLRISTRYLQFLKQIDRMTESLEKQLRDTMKNSDLLQLQDINKSLVYFSTSLKANEITIEKLARGRFVKLYEEDQDLLEDVLIEFKQAIEMTTIYSNVLSGTMDIFASLISNNLNIVMKILASLTIVLSIPTFVTGFYGMNIGVNAIPFDSMWWMPLVISVILMLISAWWLHKKDML